MATYEWTNDKMCRLQMIFFGLESEEINSYERKHFREINNR